MRRSSQRQKDRGQRRFQSMCSTKYHSWRPISLSSNPINDVRFGALFFALNCSADCTPGSPLAGAPPRESHLSYPRDFYCVVNFRLRGLRPAPSNFTEIRERLRLHGRVVPLSIEYQPADHFAHAAGVALQYSFDPW
jgi:hypothetical protein